MVNNMDQQTSPGMSQQPERKQNKFVQIAQPFVERAPSPRKKPKKGLWPDH
jgi:hypothetical protein